MAKFERDDYVKFKTGGKVHFGRVVKRENAHYSIFTDDRKQVRVHSKQLRAGSKTILILESNLSTGANALRTEKQRRAGIFLEEYFRALGVAVLREKVHSSGDFEYFMKFARPPHVRFIHINSHGSTDTKRLMLSHDAVELPDHDRETLEHALSSDSDLRITSRQRRQIEALLRQHDSLERAFDGLDAKILMLSSCSLGKRGGLAQHVSQKSISGAKAVIAYAGEIRDHTANLAESLLYFHLLTENKRNRPGKVVARVRDMLKESLGLTVPLVCFETGRRTDR